MLEVATLLRRSPIHGLGIFAGQPISKGSVVWSFRGGFDLLLDEAFCLSLSPVAQQQTAHYATTLGETTLLCGDDARFFNHSYIPNCDDSDPLRTVAYRDITEGEELTVNYDSMKIPTLSLMPTAIAELIQTLETCTHMNVRSTNAGDSQMWSDRRNRARLVLLERVAEAERRADMLAASVDHQDRLTSVLKDELETVSRELSGSISERETLTAQLLGFENREGACCPEDVGFEEYIATLQAAVARLTTEKAQYDADLAAAAGELLVPIPEAGTDAARMLIANRLLKSQLEASQQFREQAIHDIEALPTYALNDVLLYRAAVLSIVRGSA